MCIRDRYQRRVRWLFLAVTMSGGGTLYLAMGAPGAGTRTVMERVRAALADAHEFVFPTVVCSGPCKHPAAELVTPAEFQRRKVTGELQLCWTEDGVHLAYGSALRTVEAGKNVALQIPQSLIPKAEKLFAFHKKKILFVTAAQQIRRQRVEDKGLAFKESAQGTPEGPSVCLVVNNGTISEGAAQAVAALQQHARDTVDFPACSLTLPVLRHAKLPVRQYLSEQVLPEVSTALAAIAALPEKPRCPSVWLSEYLQANAPVSRQSSVQPGAVLQPAGYTCRAEAPQHVLDDPPIMQGVANLRRAPGQQRVLGLGQCTAQAVRELVQQLCAEHGSVCWVSLRDSPVLYVNGAPHCLQDEHGTGPLPALAPHCLSDVHQLHSLEAQLALELAAAASTQGGSLTLHPAAAAAASEDTEVSATAVEHTGVQTLAQLMCDLRAEGFDVSLRRAMLGAQGPPEPEELDLLVNAVREAGTGAVVLCCDSGVQRTELGLAVAGMVLGVGSQPRGYVDASDGKDTKGKAQYAGVMALCNTLGQHGRLAKACLDDLLDDHSAASKLMHLRDRIRATAERAAEGSTAQRSQAVRHTAAQATE
eukprot:TRINITY_DN15522_c0_g1_i2.p1 TRINITY_DN15522_c0_g1~~TRINITY_DN15522_c0_g1_i2.p1  ORF type:complete len:591 (-),score=204.99 TRINITY_DN15522_c0_g1_i2:280-2052(-)